MIIRDIVNFLACVSVCVLCVYACVYVCMCRRLFVRQNLLMLVSKIRVGA